MSNTKISYLYRDADNFKIHNEVVIKGELTEAHINEVIGTLNEGEWFIPNTVGLPEEKYSGTGSDHPWFELSKDGFQLVEDNPTVNISAAELHQRFIAMNDKWEAAISSSAAVTEPEHKKEITVETPLGTLVAQASGDPNYPGIYLYLRRSDGTEIDLMYAECQGVTPEGVCGAYGSEHDTQVLEHVISGYIWKNTQRDDWTHKHMWLRNQLLAVEDEESSKNA